jgi:hypothetical protein
MIIFGAAIMLGACGGGTDGTGAVPPPTATVTSSGVMTKGSVILNGTRFEPATANVIDDRGRTAAQLDTGMVIKLRGRSDDGITGIADRIDVENEARGAVQAIDATANPQRFTVGGLAVLVDDQTLYANLAGFAALAVGARVEVHGLRDSGGLLHATRVEAVAAQDGLDEMRGAVSNVLTGSHQFTLNGSTVNYSGAAFAPAGASEALLSAGIVVEARGTLNGSVFTATQIEIEDLEDDAFRGRADEKQDVEGFVTGFTVHPGLFQVNGRTVQTTSTTTFQGGTSADLANDVKVEVDGVLDPQLMLVATRIKFERTRVILQGLATAVDPTARTLIVMAQSVRANDLTRIDARPAGGGRSESLADVIANADCVEVRGHMEGAAFVAERIRELNQCNADVIQANVTGKDEANSVLSFFGALVAAMPANAQYLDGNDAAVTRAAFFALVNPAGANGQGTLVKLRGTFAGGTFTTEEAEVKN